MASVRSPEVMKDDSAGGMASSKHTNTLTLCIGTVLGRSDAQLLVPSLQFVAPLGEEHNLELAFTYRYEGGLSEALELMQRRNAVCCHVIF